MKHLKTFEQNHYIPEIGDYVICNEGDKEINDFVSKNIGKIIEYIGDNHFQYVIVKYEDIPIEIKERYFKFSSSRSYLTKQIILHSKNKEDLEILLAQNKYNL